MVPDLKLNHVIEAGSEGDEGDDVMLYLGKADCMEVMKAGEGLRDQSLAWGGKVERMPC